MAVGCCAYRLLHEITRPAQGGLAILSSPQFISPLWNQKRAPFRALRVNALAPKVTHSLRCKTRRSRYVKPRLMLARLKPLENLQTYRNLNLKVKACRKGKPVLYPPLATVEVEKAGVHLMLVAISMTHRQILIAATWAFS